MAYATPLNPNPLVQETRQLNRDSTVNLAIRHNIGDTEAEWDECMAIDLESKLADEIYPFLWLVARKSGAHIDPLHLQLIKDRDIVITEDPKLHLVWYWHNLHKASFGLSLKLCNLAGISSSADCSSNKCSSAIRQISSCAWVSPKLQFPYTTRIGLHHRPEE